MAGLLIKVSLKLEGVGAVMCAAMIKAQQLPENALKRRFFGPSRRLLPVQRQQPRRRLGIAPSKGAQTGRRF
jgi:hypothetical protein